MININDDQIYNIIKTIYCFEYGANYNSDLSTLEFVMANEICNSHYYDSFYKLYSLANYSYNFINIKINNKYYIIFKYNAEDIDKNNMIQLLICNGYTQIVSFSEGNYNNKQIISSFKNPGKAYSFFDSSLIIIESDYIEGLNYIDIKL